MLSNMDRLLVRDIMTSPPITASPDATALDAARIMKERNIGAVIVNEGQRPVGILTERDLVRKVVSEGVDPKSVRVKELMSSPVLTVAPSMDVLEAARTMARHRVRRLPVLRGQELLGIVTERDVLEVSPDLLEVTRDLEASAGDADSAFLTKCSSCGALTDGQRASDGLVFCEECWHELRTRAY
ncbi:MAG: CBS domain-containing protein [Halobacteriales archaeon]|nr:CBS domain-containing protein [Halobacteriales archaeon]